MVTVSMTLRYPDPDFKVAVFFEIRYLKTVQHRAIVTIEC